MTLLIYNRRPEGVEHATVHLKIRKDGRFKVKEDRRPNGYPGWIITEEVVNRLLAEATEIRFHLGGCPPLRFQP